MTREARLTQKYLEGEILKLLEGKDGSLRRPASNCEFCKKFDENPDCGGCPLKRFYPIGGCCHADFEEINRDMYLQEPDAIPGALAIYMWLYEL